MCRKMHWVGFQGVAGTGQCGWPLLDQQSAYLEGFHGDGRRLRFRSIQGLPESSGDSSLAEDSAGESLPDRAEPESPRNLRSINDFGSDLLGNAGTGEPSFGNFGK